MPNIELKAKYQDLDKARTLAQKMGAKPLWEDWQVDTYFYTKVGKLKLRESGKIGAELLPYVKVDVANIKRSDYAKIKIENPTLTKRLLDQLLGTRLSVEKRREVFLLGNVRIHLDQVEKLGNFIEFEAVFENDTPEYNEREKRKVQELMLEFEIRDEDIFSGSYPDLIEK